MDYPELIKKAMDGDYQYHRKESDTRESRREAQVKLDKKFHDDLINVLIEQYGNRVFAHNFTEKIAEKIFTQAWEDEHSNGYYSVVQRAIILADLVDDCILALN